MRSAHIGIMNMTHGRIRLMINSGNYQNKICPLARIGYMANSHPRGDEHIDKTCDGPKCAFWTSIYTTEGHVQYSCAIIIGALKDSEGRLPV